MVHLRLKVAFLRHVVQDPLCRFTMRNILNSMRQLNPDCFKKTASERVKVPSFSYASHRNVSQRLASLFIFKTHYNYAKHKSEDRTQADHRRGKIQAGGREVPGGYANASAAAANVGSSAMAGRTKCRPAQQRPAIATKAAWIYPGRNRRAAKAAREEVKKGPSVRGAFFLFRFLFQFKILSHYLGSWSRVGRADILKKFSPHVFIELCSKFIVVSRNAEVCNCFTPHIIDRKCK